MGGFAPQDTLSRIDQGFPNYMEALNNSSMNSQGISFIISNAYQRLNNGGTSMYHENPDQSGFI